MNKVAHYSDVRSLLKDGMTLMIGGFLGCGTPEGLIDLIIEMDLKELTIIGNDTSFINKGIGRLVANGNAKKVIVSHIGTNPESGKRMTEGTMEVELSPQGTLIERIRAGGSGLGGVITPTGVGTIVEEGKEKIVLEGREYLIEMPLRADAALIYASVSDTFGNLYYKGTTRNFNPIIALAADKVIVEAEEIVEAGEINPEIIMTPGVLVDFVIKGAF